MSGKLEFRIAVTGRARAEIAAQIAPAFYQQIQGSGPDEVTLSIGRSDSELGGLGAPIVVDKTKYHFGLTRQNPGPPASVFHDPPREARASVSRRYCSDCSSRR